MAIVHRKCRRTQEPDYFATKHVSVHSYKIKGMRDMSAARRVQDSLKQIPGFLRVFPDLETGVIRIEYDPEFTDPNYLETAITMAGFDPADLEP